MTEAELMEEYLTAFKNIIELVPTHILQSEEETTKPKKRKKHSLIELKDKFDHKVKKLETHRSNV
jgi:hypothetical protein